MSDLSTQEHVLPGTAPGEDVVFEVSGYIDLDEMLAGTVISGRRSATPVMCAQTAAAMPAAGEALQKCAALSHGAACLVRPRSRVACDALLL